MVLKRLSMSTLVEIIVLSIHPYAGMPSTKLSNSCNPHSATILRIWITFPGIPFFYSSRFQKTTRLAKTHIIGSNFKLTLKSEEELKQMVASSGLYAHQRALVLIGRLFQKGRVQEMYSKLSLYIVTLVHLAFLDYQRKQHSLEKISRPNIRIKSIQSLHKI